VNILYLDSSTEACTAGVAINDRIIADFAIAPRGHAQRLLPMAEEMLARAGIGYPDLDLVAFGRGPGSFTGVRIATAMAQGIAMARDLPMMGMSSLECLAWGAWRRFKDGTGPLGGPVEHSGSGPMDGLDVLVAIDARMGEIYRAGYRIIDGQLTVIEPESVGPPGLPRRRDRLVPVVAVGSGFARYPELLDDGLACSHDSQALPQADDALDFLSRTGRQQWLAPDQAIPHYLRNQVATVAT